MEGFGAATRQWFEQAFASPTPVQQQGWEAIARGEHALLIAPTGSGKTLAAFLWALNQLASAPPERPGVRVLYVSPLKALAMDIERNLALPLAGIQATAKKLGQPVHVPRVGLRTGDTPPKERAQQRRLPPEILVTTPESLYLMLSSRMRETLTQVQTLIIDEVHALAGTKRGAHLALSLERLSALGSHDAQRIGLSATARPLSEVARFLGGDRPVTLVDAHMPPQLSLRIQVPVPDMHRPPPVYPDAVAPTPEELDVEANTMPSEPKPVQAGLWPHLNPKILALIQEHQSTIVFVNSRGLCERLAKDLNELAGEALVRAHHGSLAHTQRKDIEEALKSGWLRGIVATSSLELGIDMGAVDLVVLVESPGAVSRGLQRVGRAGHKVGEHSSARLFPKHRADLLEAVVVAQEMRAGAIESLRMPQNALDVLAQQIVAMVAMESWEVGRLAACIRRAAPYRELPAAAFEGLLDMLTGRYPSQAFADLRPRLLWDRETDQLTARKGARMTAIVSGGTIVDRGAYAVHLGEGGPRLGELDEEMVHETLPGQTFLLGASTWRIERVTRDRVIVQPAPGETGRLPFWHGEGPGRPLELGRALGAFTRELAALAPEEAARSLAETHGLDAYAIDNLLAYLRAQREATGTLPTDRALTIEAFPDELGDWRICILSPFGRRVHGPWALAIEAQLSARAGFEVQTLYSDDGIVLRLAEGSEIPALELLLPKSDEVEDLVLNQVEKSPLFAAQFRESAVRSLLLARRLPGARRPLWAQRLKAQQLLAAARQYSDFPMVMEAYRSCLRDVFDLPALCELLRAVERQELRVDRVETREASPFAQSLVFAYVASAMYGGDTVLAEHQAQALQVDRNLLQELLGPEALRALLDRAIIEEVEASLQGLARPAEDAEALCDLIRRVGDLSRAELAQRCTADLDASCAVLEQARRIVRVHLGGETRWLAVEDVAAYRDAFDVVPPAGLAEVFLASRENKPLAALLQRYARCHGPFTLSQLSQRYPLARGKLRAALDALVAEGVLLCAPMHPDRIGDDYCDREVLQRIKRRTLAKLRREVAPVDAATLGRFLPRWHRIAEAPHAGQLEASLAQLEGLPLPFSELETQLLPARVPDYAPARLDELGALGYLVWVGCGALGAHDGRVALYRRSEIGKLLVLAPPLEDDPVATALEAALRARGACFFVGLEQVGAGASRDEVLAALWRLVWAGRVTNDSIEALRAFTQGGKGRSTRRTDWRAASGRWSLVEALVEPVPDAQRRQHLQALRWLERYGLLSKELATLEALPGGFTRWLPLLKAFEETGRVRRGYFAEGLGGMQFALPAALERLRAGASTKATPECHRLAAVDPANPYGWLLPWPKLDKAAAFRRATGCQVILVNGLLRIYLERGGTHLRYIAEGATEQEALAAFSELKAVARGARGRRLRIERLNGESVQRFPQPQLLQTVGFRRDPRGYVLDG